MSVSGFSKQVISHLKNWEVIWLLATLGNNPLSIGPLNLFTRQKTFSMFLPGMCRQFLPLSVPIPGDSSSPPSSQVIKREGTGTEMPMIGDRVFVHYTGWLLDGTKFDSSLDRKDKFSFDLGKGRQNVGLKDRL